MLRSRPEFKMAHMTTQQEPNQPQPISDDDLDEVAGGATRPGSKLADGKIKPGYTEVEWTYMKLGDIQGE